MRGRFLLALCGFLTVTLISFGPFSDVAGYYGDPRFFSQQTTTRLLHNVSGDDYLVTSAGASVPQQTTVTNAITHWNDALRSAPNSLTKYPLHFNQHNDPNANVIVDFVSPETVHNECWQPGME